MRRTGLVSAEQYLWHDTGSRWIVPHQDAGIAGAEDFLSGVLAP